MQGISLVVTSCDDYSDLWRAFFSNLKRKWPDQPFPTYLLTNERGFTFPGVTVLRVGPDKGWSTNLISALRRIPDHAILLFLDDLFLKDSVGDGENVYRLCERFLTEKMDYLRFNPTPGPSGGVDSDLIGPVAPGDNYRASTVVCLWRRSVLLDVLREGESAWEFEVFGSARTDKYSSWYASDRWLLPTANLVIKGRFHPGALRLFQREGLLRSSSRPVMSPIQYASFLLVRIRAALFRLVPRRFRRRIRERFGAT